MSRYMIESSIIWLIFLPLATAIAAFLLPRLARALGLLTALMLWLPLAGLACQLLRHGTQHYALGGWQAPLGIHLRADGLSFFMLLTVALVGFFVSLYSAAYFCKRTDSARAKPQQGTYFWPSWLFLWASLNALFLSDDIFNIYVALELLSVAAIALTALARTATAQMAAMRYLLVSLLGSLFYLFAIALVYAAYASLDLGLLKQRLSTEPVVLLIVGFMSTGLIMKTALFPLHFWLPPAHAAAPAPVSALLSALVVKASLYLLLRLWFETFSSLPLAQGKSALGILGAGAILWGSYQAYRQAHLKTMIAYSTVAQLGYIFLMFPLAAGSSAFTAWAGGLYFLLSHACAKAAVFFCAGNLMRVAGHDRISELSGTMKACPLSMFAFGLAAVSLIGLPPSGGFIAKWMLLNAALASGQWWWVLVILAGTLLSAAYLMRILKLPFSESPPKRPRALVSFALEGTALLLALGTIALGFVAPIFLDYLRIGAPFSGSLLTGGAP
ncbi:MAG: hypothetical protein JJT82_09190 [Legionellaceae bacterium]|nr:hypothetical protein [Legionellaceae bacterium]